MKRDVSRGELDLAAVRGILHDPPREFSVMPFWFWNDELQHAEILRQIADFQEHGVHGFVIHPRIGLPEDLVWMSEAYLDYCETAVREAQRRGMYVILYDEGMYPSGSSAGQVVAADSRYQARCLAAVELEPGEEPQLGEDEVLVAVLPRQNAATRRLPSSVGDCRWVAIIERPAKSYIRGLHYLDDGDEELHLAADILNPEAVDCFLGLVYERYWQRLGQYFGSTILGIFTDEPHQLARCQEPVPVVPGMRKTLENVNRVLGCDFTPHLLSLWYEDEPDSDMHRRDYDYAVAVLHNEIYYTRLQAFCQKHGLALTGHPAGPGDLGALKYFEIPGQDVVLRWVLPDDPSALAGPQSTQAKGTSSVMLHSGRRRNLNEFCGGFGSETTWEEMNWVAKWLLVRGVNLLVPHAFYYSVRDQRVNERPPQLGPHAPWWPTYSEHAHFCRRLCWLNTDSGHVCRVAVLGAVNMLPWRAAKLLFEQQIDFNYLDEDTLLQEADVAGDGLRVGNQHYDVLVIERNFPLRCRNQQGWIPAAVGDTLPDLAALAAAGRVVIHDPEATTADLVDSVVVPLRRWTAGDTPIQTAEPGIRLRTVTKVGLRWTMVFNEVGRPQHVQLSEEKAAASWLALYDPWTDQWDECPPLKLDLPPFGLVVWVTV